MAIVMTPIYTQTVGAGGASSITFNNIPQIFTDLLVVASVRGNHAYDAGNIQIRPNAALDNLSSTTHIVGNQNGISSYRNTSTSGWFTGTLPGTTVTANTFASCQIYIPNYTSSNFKSAIIDSVSEANSTTAMRLELVAGLWRSTAAITSLQFAGDNQYVQHSTFSLYGIIRSGA